MEKLKLISLFVVTFVFMTISSCKRNEILYEPTTGVLNCQLQLADKRVYNCEIDQTNLTIKNSVDSLIFGTSSEVLKNMKIVFTGTVGSELYYNGQKIISGETVIDFSKPVVEFESRYGSAVKKYSATAFVERFDYSQTSGSKINGDIRLTGYPSSAFTSGATYFKGKLYMISSSYPNGTSATGTAYYHLYRSDNNGASWSKVETNMKVIGGFGSRLAVLNDKLFVVGGMRTWGRDEDGKNPESSIAWKILSSTDGVNFTDCTVGQTGNPTGRAFAEVVVHNGELFVRRGKMYGFGMIQNINQTIIYKTSDGTNWTTITPNNINATNRQDAAFYSFNGKLWLQGGLVSFISPTGLKSDLWSSADNGVTWVEETPVLSEGASLTRYAHSVVSSGNTAYMMFGETLNAAGERVGAGGVIKSTDGINWAPLENNLQLPASCSKRILANVVNGEDNLFYIIGGFSQSAGNYLVSGITMDVLYDVWTKRIK